LTGIDAHLVVGKTVSTLLSIPKSATQDDDTSKCIIGSRREDQEGKRAAVNFQDANTHKTNPKKSKNILNRLISTSGLGKIHNVLLHTMQQIHMVGQNVTIKHNKSYSKQQSEDSNDTSLTSNSERKKPLYFAEQEIPVKNCQISVAPVVPSTANFERHESNKRAKHTGSQHMQDLPKLYYESQEATHYVIQIAPLNSNIEKSNVHSEAILSSNSVEEQIPLRLTDKISTLDQNVESNSGGSISVQSSDPEAIVAIG
jgi:hypothetical protein